MSEFYVWKRSDNHVDCTTYMPQSWKTTDGDIVSFELLEKFSEWSEAVVAYIIEQRIKGEF